jgi:two-component system LytT family response regulator
VVVADDEAPARERLTRFLRGQPAVREVIACESGEEAVAAIREADPDLVFLDVQMPGVDGFGVVEQIGLGAMPPVVFATAYDRYAVQAFESAALDYLLKPFDDERFLTTFQRALARIRYERGTQLASALATLLGGISPDEERPRPARAGTPLDRLLVPAGENFRFVATAEIRYIMADAHHVLIHAAGETYQLRRRLKDLEAELDPERFVRIHRSTILNVEWVHEIRPWFGGDYRVILRDGEELKLSRTHRELIERFIPGVR